MSPTIKRHRTLSSIVKIFIAIFFVNVVAMVSVSATSVYSDVWSDDSNPDSPFMVGCGVTEANYGDDWELHNVRATTTIRKPNGASATRTSAVYYSWSSGSSFTARAEPVLLWDWSEVGDFIVSTRHYSTCPATELGNTSTSSRVGVSTAYYLESFDRIDGTCDYSPLSGCNVTCKPSTVNHSCETQYLIRIQQWTQPPFVGRICTPGLTRIVQSFGPHTGSECRDVS